MLGQPGSGPGSFNEPAGLTIDSQGNLYVTDILNHRVQKFDAEGKFLAQVGGNGSGEGQFNEPWGVAVDLEGNLWVADTFNHRIQKFDPDFNFLLAFGVPATSQVDPESDAFWGPRDVAIDPEGNIWVADTGTARMVKYGPDGRVTPMPGANLPLATLGTFILWLGWFGFNVMSAQTLDKMSGLVAINSLMAMVGGTLTAWWMGKNDPGFSYNGPLAGLVAVCAGSDVMHPLGALAVGGIAGVLFVWMFTRVQNVWRIDDVLGVWPLHGLCGAWGGIAAGIFGLKALGGLGGVSFWAQVAGTAGGIVIALVGGTVVYGTLRKLVGLRLDREAEFMGADLAIHRVSSTPESETHW